MFVFFHQELTLFVGFLESLNQINDQIATYLVVRIHNLLLTKMEPITKEEIYHYYMENNVRFQNKVELVQAFMVERLNISLQNVNQETGSALHDQIIKLENKLKAILKNVKSMKKSQHLQNSYFMTIEELDLFMNIYKSSTLKQDIQASDELIDKRHSNENKYKHFSDLTS